MRVRAVLLQNYRNLKNCAVEPSAGVNVICGDNAQGKTNFLESMWIFTGGRSFRGAKDRELVAFGEHFAKAFFTAESFGREQNLQVAITPGGKREVTVNKVPQESASALVGRFCAVVFSPVHLALVKEGPGVRRKFLDTAICQIQPKYAKQILRYNHILSQRNSLLRDLKKSNKFESTLEIWDEKIAECAATLLLKRQTFVGALKPSAAKFYEGLSAGRETMSLQYRPSVQTGPGETEEALKWEIFKKFEQLRQEDIAAGFTTRGPHRDDLEIKINGKSARQFSSQGQQRSAVLAMKLAKAELIQRKIGEPPVILLDDVLSELDATRQSYLLNSIAEKQVFITCCERDLGKKLAAGAVFTVEQGEIRAEL